MDGSTEARFSDIPIVAGETHSYRFHFDPALVNQPGASLAISGAFSGGGQNATVDQLLSYARPGQKQTALPGGTTSYQIHIFYGPNLIPATFAADLNSSNVTSLFHPVPGGNELVAIPLLTGKGARTVLNLSATGLFGGKQSTDKDQLVFKLP
jgi:hypothetical protein